MEHKRIIKGNNTIIPTGAECLSAYETNATSAKKKDGKPTNIAQCVVDSRDFSIENQK